VECAYELFMPDDWYGPTGDRPSYYEGGCKVVLRFDASPAESHSIQLGAAPFAERDRLRAAFDHQIAALGLSAIAVIRSPI
jgi:hypothetical protein